MATSLEKLPYPLAIQSEHAECLTEIFRDDVNLAVWDRPTAAPWTQFSTRLLEQTESLERFVSLDPRETASTLLPEWAMRIEGADLWLDDLNHLVDMFRCLFEPQAVGVRLHAVRGPLCPRFHTDRVPVRLLSTYMGPGTEWLPEQLVQRPAGNGPLPDQTVATENIHHIPAGGVALLKGEAWIGNEGRGLVHRSPSVDTRARLMIGLDWLSH